MTYCKYCNKEVETLDGYYGRKCNSCYNIINEKKGSSLWTIIIIILILGIGLILLIDSASAQLRGVDFSRTTTTTQGSCTANGVNQAVAYFNDIDSIIGDSYFTFDYLNNILRVGNRTGGDYSCKGTSSLYCSDLGEGDCYAMQNYGFCYWEDGCYENDGIMCDTIGGGSEGDCAIAGCEWSQENIDGIIKGNRIKASCEGDGGNGANPCILWSSTDGYINGGFSNSEFNGYPHYNLFYLNGNSTEMIWLGEWDVNDVGAYPSGDRRASVLMVERESANNYRMYTALRSASSLSAVWSAFSNGGFTIGTNAQNNKADKDSLYIPFGNLTVGKYIKTVSQGNTPLLTCNAGFKNQIGSNNTGTFGCNGTQWVRLF